MATANDVVLAGTKAFALALFAPLTERSGTRPRIAPEPQQALTLCSASSGVLVVEYGEAWLPVLRQLRLRAAGLRIVAALPRGLEAAALVLGPLGIEAVPWDGQPGPVLSAVEGLTAGVQPAPRPAVRPPAVQAPAPGAAPQPAQQPDPSPAAGVPARPAPPKLAATMARAVATTPPFGVPVRDAPRPPPAAVAPPAPPVAAPARGDASPSEAELFSGLDEPPPAEAAPAVDAPPRSAAGPAGPELAAPPAYTGPPKGLAAPRAAAEWPATAPSEHEAESALVLYVRGRLKPEAPLAGVTKLAVAAMSELERQVLAGAALPFDGQPVYRAAVLRLRVAAALATVPASPARVDDAAVQAMLAEFDALLALVNPLAQGAPPEHQLSLEAVRNALVREAVDFSEATHRITSPGPPPDPEASTRSASRGPAAATRVLTVQSGEAQEGTEGRRRRGPLAALVVLVIAIAAVLAWQQLTKPPVQVPRSYEGAPAHTVAVENGPYRMLLAAPGKAVDPGELERFRKQELKKGNLVTEVAPGNWLVEPAPATGQGASP